MLLALDLDGVLCDLGPGLAARLRAAFGVSTHPSTWRSYDLSDLGVPHGELRPFLDATFADPALYRTAPVCDGAAPALDALAGAGWSFVGVTARPAHLAAVTREWLAARSLPVEEVHHAPLLGKREVVARLGAAAAIDDHPGEAEALAEVCDALLFDRPWNAAHVATRCGRVRSWDEVVRRLAGRRSARRAS